MKATESQIERARINYNLFLKLHTLSNYNVEVIGMNEAERRMNYHNSIINDIASGNKEIENKWKLFFLSEEIKADQKREEIKSRLTSNKEASSDILKPIKDLKKIGEFGKWLNTSGNKFRKEHFSKKYTQESVNLFLSTL
jgi:hypothetical protein